MSRVVRTVGWVRREGIGKALEEKELRPVDLRREMRSRSWALRNGEVGSSGLIVIAGVQRSGTNMLLRALRAAPELQVIDEGDRRAFRRFRLVDDRQLQHAIAMSRHQAVVIKPLCDAHRTPALLHLVPARRTTAIWSWRGVDATSRSNVARFSHHALDVVTEIASTSRPRCWQAEGLSDETLAVVRSIGRAITDPFDAAALLWWARNKVAFDRDLDRDHRVLPLRYEAMRSSPVMQLHRLCDHVGITYRTELHDEIDPARATELPVQLRHEVRARCEELTEQLEAWTSRTTEER